MSKQNVDSLVKQFIKHNKDDLPAMHRMVSAARNDYKRIKAKHGVLSAVHSAYKIMDTLIKEGFAKDPTPISCHNCTAAYCCHQSVDICEDEATAIAHYCEENNIIIPKAYLLEQLAYTGEQIPYANCSACVFLKDNRCSIYPARPSSCRTYYAWTPKEFCDSKTNKGHKVGFISNNPAELVKTAMAMEGGKVDRMPRLLLKYSR